MKRQLLAEAWNRYASDVILPSVDLTQKRDLRRAFYCGAKAFLSIAANMFTPGDEPTDHDVEILEGVQNELRTFIEKVRAGAA